MAVPPENLARETIDQRLRETGWMSQSRDAFNRHAAPGKAV